MFRFPPLDGDYASAIGGLLFAISGNFASVRSFVIPAQAGIQQRPRLDSRLRGNDRMKPMLSDA
jgi:hypothetical protein